MKKLLFFLLTIVMCGFAAAPLSAQGFQIVEILGDGGTNTNSYLPAYTLFNNTLSEQIYTAEEVGMAGTISSIAFYNGGSEKTPNIKIYLVNTDQTEFSSSTNWLAVTEEDLVFTGDITFTPGQWTTIELDNTFAYDGVSNLGLIVDEYMVWSSGLACRVFNSTPNCAMYVYSDPTDYNAVGATYTASSRLAVKNQIQLGITPGDISCHPVSGLSVTDITSSNAVVSWTASEDANGYIVQYKTPTQNWDDYDVNTDYTADTSYDFSGTLNPITTYNVRVASLCGGGDTSVWRSATFMSGCDAITITETDVWFENFDAYSGSGEQPFVCWETPISTPGGGPFVYCGYSSSCHSGANSAELKGASNMLVLPEFTNPIQELRLSFWATAVTPTNGTLEIGVLTDMDDLTSFELLGLSGTPSTRNGVGNYMGPFDFNGITATTGRIALRYTSSGTGNSWNLDDFTVELSPSCNSPVKTSVTASGIDGHNATISWVDNDDSHNSWTVYYKASTDADYASISSTDTFLVLTGLDPETTYNVYVVTNCDGIPSEDATIIYNFTTAVACPAPTQVTAAQVNIYDATITWNSSATTFNVEYGETGFAQGSGTTETVYNNTITLNFLDPQTAYTIYVQADCGPEDGTSQWASVQFTTLPSCPAPTNIVASNLTATSTELVWEAGYEETEWELEYGLQDFTHGTGTVVSISGTPSYELQNLTSNTRYDVYVRAICSGTDTSAWSNLYFFLTPCEAAQIPYTENFDSYPSWYSPDCWRKFENGNTGSYVSYGAYIYNEQAYSGDKALKFVASTSTSGYALLRLPDFDTDDITGLQVKLMAKMTSGSRPLIVGVTPDFNSIDSIFVLATFSDLTSAYDEKIVSLASYPGTIGYIVIGLPKGYSSSATTYVDDLSVEERPDCMYPTNFAAAGINETSVTLSWTELGTSESWVIEYGLAGFTPGEGTIETVSGGTVYTVENLEESTAYDFYLQSDCGGFYSQQVGPLTVVTSQYFMAVTGSDTITTCGAMIYDNGGPNGDYSTDCNSVLVIYPATEGTMVMLEGTSNTESNYDYLSIYDGVGTNGTQLANYSGQHNISVISTTGPLTIHFTSDYTVVRAGFELLATCVSCFPPGNLSVSNATTEGATISWSGEADEYAVYVIGSDTLYFTTSETSIDLTGLQPSSTYSVRVRSLCVGDSSVLSAAILFNTSCDAITVTADNPWFEDFESYSGSGEQPFVCWETPIHPNGPFVYCGHSPSCHSGSNSAEFKGSQNMLVLPDFSNDIHELRLSFWATATSTSLGQVEVGVVTDANDPSSFELLGLAGAPGPRGNSGSGHGNYMGPFDFNGIQATNGRIALRYTSTDSYASWNLDDFTVSLTPGCPSPVKTSVQASNIDGHNATITFVDNDPDHNSWTVYYKASSEAGWASEVTNTQSATLTNLDPETTYEVYVVTNCATPDEVEDATNHMFFTTAVACPAPQNLSVSNIGMSTATLTWFSNADSFTIEYGEAGFTPGTGTTEISTTSTIDLSGLTAGTAYTVIITADCGSVDGTSSAASVNFITALCETEDQCAYTFNLIDSYGDGWNGGTLAVQQNGITAATLGLTNGYSATQIVNLCHGANISLVWNAGSFASEASFTVTASTGEQLYASPSMDSYSTYTFQANCSGCPMPSDLAVSNITTESAFISWSGNADSYTVEYGETGFALGTGTILTTTNTSVELTNLVPATSYTVYVSSNCGSETSSSAILNFATSICDSIYQCTYTFNLSDSYGDGWNGASLAVQQNGITVASLTLSSGSSATETVILCEGIPTSLVWSSGSYDNETSFTVSDPSGAEIFATSNASSGTLTTFITNCSGSTPVVCNTPTNLTVTDITENSAVASWTAGGDETAWNLQYKTAVSTDWGTLIPCTQPTYTFTDLAANTQYMFRVQADCGDNVSTWSNATSFTTLPEEVQPCNVPTNLHTTTIQNEAISIAWDADANVSSWNIQYRPVGGNLTTATSNTNSYTITGLTGLTTYEIQVQANCGDGNLSDWTAAITPQTTNVGIANYLENSVVLFPNPANDVVNVQCTMNNVQLEGIEVIDIYGKVVRTVVGANNYSPMPTRINVSGLASGMYFVRVTMEKGTVTKTFVKK